MLTDEEKAMRVPITPDILQTLHHYRTRTGVGSIRLLKGKKDAPVYLTPKHIESWLSGRVKTAPHKHLEYVLDQWSHLPQWDFVSVTHEHVRDMQAQSTRTKVGPRVLLQTMPDKPDGLEHYTIEAWMSGRSRTARKDHLDCVLGCWSALPAANRVRYLKSGYREITKAQHDRLHALKAQSGLGPNAVMRGAKDAPSGLGSETIKGWMVGTIQSARPAHLHYVLNRWEALRKTPGA